MSEYSTEAYENFYNSHYENIEMSVDCINANKCSSISEFIHQLMDKLNNMKELDWDDNVSYSFKQNITICHKSLNNIKNSIDTDFTNSENKYLESYELLNQLKSKYDLLKAEINDKPTKDFYKKEVTNLFTGEKTIKYPGYENALGKWNKKCNKLDLDCKKLMNDIETILKELENIDGKKINVVKSKLVSIPGLTKKIELNQEYRYYMSDYNMRVCGTNNPFKSSGCSVASAAVAFSLAKGIKIDPVTVNEQGRTLNTGADRVSMITNLTKLQGLNLNVVKNADANEVEQMLKRLESGESTVIARIARNSKGIFSSKSGHYLNLVDSRVNSDGQVEVLVWDAGYKHSKTYRQGWHKLTEITNVINPNSSFFEISENYLQG